MKQLVHKVRNGPQVQVTRFCSHHCQVKGTTWNQTSHLCIEICAT